MATPTPALVDALRRLHTRLADENTPFQWTHMGRCICGALAQELTPFSEAELHARALQSRGDWTEQAEAWCHTAGAPLDLVLSRMFELGMTAEDVRYLERLGDPDVLRRIPLPARNRLRYTRRADVLTYLAAWIDLLAEALPARFAERAPSVAVYR